MMLYDISPLLDETVAVWPGDTPLRFRDNLRLEDGDSVNLSDLHVTCHCGAHADAPNHVIAGAAGIDELDLEAFLGPCRLVEITGAARIGRRELEGIDLGGCERLLIRSRSGADRRSFDPSFPHLMPDAAQLLVDRGLRLVGVDVPSIDAFDSTDLPVHHILFAAGVRNLESLVLDGVPPGDYELIALPLPLAGRDASPVRAVLRTLGAAKREPT